jgi:glycine betaine/proline transport system ATP-binding protein
MNARVKIENLYKVFAKDPAPALAMLQRGCSKSQVLEELGHVVGVHDLSLSVPAGAMYMVMGLSGSGKSTLARCINRLNEPSAGRILLDGEDICALDEKALREVRRNRVSMVFQHFALLPNRRVIENVEFGLKLRGMPAPERRKRAEEVLGLTRWAYHMPHELSGGMRQRVGLARALATDADVLIMDEAFSALDPLIRCEMQDELLRLQRVLKKTILFITHDFQEALKLGTRIAVMSEGKLVREGTPQDIVLEPGSDYVAAFTRDVDRTRLFDARSVMSPIAVIADTPQGSVMGHAEGGELPGFLVDREQRVLGRFSADAVARSRAGASGLKPESDFICVPSETKIVDVASRYRDGQPMGVVDESGRLIGLLDASRILAGISGGRGSTVAGSSGSTGVPHA